MPVIEPIEFSFDAPTWSLGKSMSAHITMGRIGEVYNKDLKDTIYGLRDWRECSSRNVSVNLPALLFRQSGVESPGETW